MSKKVAIFDSSLRDGAQAEGISFSVEDKLKLLELLDGHGVDYIEAGNPGSNPKDLEFFARAKAIRLKHARLAAFGSTRRRDIQVEQDSNVHSLLLADTPEDFAAQVVRLLRDGALNQQIAAGGRRSAELHYDWRSVYRAWDAVYA